MALKRLEASLDIIAALGDNPGVDDGLSSEPLKKKFDVAANIIKDYLNNYLILEIEKTVDVESLLSDILDVTLSKKDKAANALATGDAIRGLRYFFEKVVHGGDYVLESGSNLAAEVVSYATVHIGDGTGVMLGNLFSLDAQDVTLAEGTYGLRRNDLIVVRCTKGETGALSYSLASLTGTNTSGDPVDPSYTQSDINANGTIREFPIYRVKFNGVDIASVESLFEAEEPLGTYLKKYAQTTSISVTLLASGWSESAPYTQSVQVAGLSDNLRAEAYPNWPEDAEAEAAMWEEVAKVSSCRRSGNTMTFRCLEDKPVLDIPVIVEVSV